MFNFNYVIFVNVYWYYVVFGLSELFVIFGWCDKVGSLGYL